MDLRVGVQVISHQLALAGLGDRLSLSSGMCSAPRQINGFRYCPSAIIPREPWYSITPSESDVLIGTSIDCTPGEWISLVKIPDEVLVAFEGIRQAVLDLPTYDSVNGALSHAQWQPALDAFAVFAKRFIPNDDGCDQTARIRANAPGLPTVTIDNASACLIGLHLDSWFGTAVEGRHLLPNRIAANFGVEPRYLLFLNLSLAEIVRLVTEGAGVGSGRSGGSFIQQFAALFPHYPVTRLRLEPGEAYIAPTENIIHDGSTVGMSTWDVHVAELGRFEVVSGE